MRSKYLQLSSEVSPQTYFAGLALCVKILVTIRVSSFLEISSRGATEMPLIMQSATFSHQSAGYAA